MLISFCIAILIISIMQLFLLRVANYSDGLKKIAMRETVRYLMVVPVYFTFMLAIEYVLEGDLPKLCFILIIFLWSSYYLSFGMRNRTIAPILNFICSSILLIGVYAFIHPPVY